MPDIRTIYAVSSGSYSDYSVNLIFESKKDAEAFVLAKEGDYQVETFTLVPAGFPLAFWKRLVCTWREEPFMNQAPAWEYERGCSNVDDKPMPQPVVVKAPVQWAAKHSAHLTVEGDDHERVRKVFTEQLAGYKLELPLIRAAAASKAPKAKKL